MNAQAVKAGDTVTVKESTGSASGGDHDGFSKGFVRQFGKTATVVEANGGNLVLNFGTIVTGAKLADLSLQPQTPTTGTGERIPLHDADTEPVATGKKKTT